MKRDRVRPVNINITRLLSVSYGWVGVVEVLEFSYTFFSHFNETGGYQSKRFAPSVTSTPAPLVVIASEKRKTRTRVNPTENVFVTITRCR